MCAILQPNEPVVLVFLNPQHGIWPSRKHTLPPDKKCTIPSIMKAILLTAGPVSNFTSFRDAGPRYMWDIITQEQYSEAAHRLEEANLGEYVTIFIGNSRPKEMFIKKAPVEAEEILMRNNELCIAPAEYAWRFNMGVHRKIMTGMRRKLVNLGYVTEEQISED